LDLWPVGECGMQGECVEADVNVSGDVHCQCDPGWSQSLEMNFLDFSILNETKSICISNQYALDVLYGILLVVIIIHTFMLCRRVHTNKPLYGKRSWWFWMSISVLFIAIYRLANKEALMGVDIWLTSFVAWCMPVHLLLAYSFRSRYLRGLSERLLEVTSVSGMETGVGKCEKYKDSAKTFYLRANKARKFLYYIYIGLGFVCNNFWITIMIYNYPRCISLYLVKSAFGYYAFLIIYQTIFFFFSITELEKDIKKTLECDVAKMKIASVGTDIGGDNNGVDNDALELKDSLVELERMRKTLVVTASLQIFFYGASSISDLFVLLWAYLTPLHFIVFYIDAIVYFIRQFYEEMLTELNSLNQNDENLALSATTSEGVNNASYLTMGTEKTL